MNCWREQLRKILVAVGLVLTLSPSFALAQMTSLSGVRSSESSEHEVSEILVERTDRRTNPRRLDATTYVASFSELRQRYVHSARHRSRPLATERARLNGFGAPLLI